jgi:hypothetical protein
MIKDFIKNLLLDGLAGESAGIEAASKAWRGCRQWIGPEEFVEIL